MRTKKANTPAPGPIVIETFNRPSEYTLNVNANPSCMNGNVRVIKYRVTIEPIEEPIEVIHSRLEKLWLECDNHHHWEPLEQEAKKHGYTFKGERGSNKKSKSY